MKIITDEKKRVYGYDPYLIAALIWSYVAFFSILTVRSTTETSTVGTRKAIPVNFPLSAGKTFPTAYTITK
jgi:hypothetical protein